MQPNFITILVRSPEPDIWSTLKPKETQTWVKELPSADYTQVANLVLTRLQQMNQVEADPLSLFESTELIRPAIYDLIGHFSNKPIGTKLPLSDENKVLSAQLLSIATELSTTYWHIADCLLDTSTTQATKKKSAVVVQRALASLGQVVFLHYLFKRAEPMGVWLDIHQLFITFQEHWKRTVNDEVASEQPKTSILACYKQLVLLRMAQPYELLQAEIVELFFLLEKWSELVELELLDENPNEKKASCLIDFHSDSAAIWQPFLGHLNLSNLLRLLNDHEEFVDGQIGRYETNTEKGRQLSISAGLILHLETCWSKTQAPTERLFETGSTRVCSLGLKAIHNSLTNNTETQPLVEQEWLAETLENNQLKVLFSEPETLSLGQLVAFRQPKGSRQNLILAITSKVFYQGDPIQFQLLSLTNRPYPASILPIDSGDQNPQPAPIIIFFSSEEGEDKKTWIIVESKNIKVGDHIELITSKSTVFAKILLRKHIGAWCYLLQCKVLKNPL